MSEEFIDMKGQPKRELERELALNYNLEQVVADLIDNSIDAGAENVWVIYNEEEYNNHNSFFVAVADDGSGIADENISSVMDFGAPREYDELEHPKKSEEELEEYKNDIKNNKGSVLFGVLGGKYAEGFDSKDN